jgi:hypothetical protein
MRACDAGHQHVPTLSPTPLEWARKDRLFSMSVFPRTGVHYARVRYAFRRDFWAYSPEARPQHFSALSVPTPSCQAGARRKAKLPKKMEKNRIRTMQDTSFRRAPDPFQSRETVTSRGRGLRIISRGGKKPLVLSWRRCRGDCSWTPGKARSRHTGGPPVWLGLSRETDSFPSCNWDRGRPP